MAREGALLEQDGSDHIEGDEIRDAKISNVDGTLSQSDHQELRQAEAENSEKRGGAIDINWDDVATTPVTQERADAPQPAPRAAVNPLTGEDQNQEVSFAESRNEEARMNAGGGDVGDLEPVADRPQPVPAPQQRVASPRQTSDENYQIKSERDIPPAVVTARAAEETQMLAESGVRSSQQGLGQGKQREVENQSR